MKERYDAVIIGGGIAGLSTAYNLARLGYGSIAVLERKYVGSGSSTRNASRFRVHFYSRENAVFAVESARRLKALSRRLGWNPVITTGGYLWLIHNEEELKAFAKYNDTLWRELGIRGEILEPHEVAERYPYLRVEGIVGAFYGPQDGGFHHDAVVYGYAYKASRLGVDIVEHAEARRIIVESDRVRGVEVNGGGVVKTGSVVVAAGVWSGGLLEPLGIRLPLKPVRKHALVTRGFKYTIKPFIVSTRHNGYFTQTLKGELLGSLETEGEEGLEPLEPPLSFLTGFSRMLVDLLKGASSLRVMRAWTGHYYMSPDKSHVLGRDSEWPEGLYVATGFSGHGFMMSHYAGELLASFIATGRVHPHMAPYLPSRFREGRLIHEDLVIG